MSKYKPQESEKKLAKKWEEDGIYEPEMPSKKDKWYSMFEFPYPSGDGLHTGHIRTFTAMDLIARKRRMEGYNVLFPVGWDAFGLPTENYAIKTGTPPQEVTKQNTDNFRRQMKSLGYSVDWSREVNTTDPEYYKWTQWIFLQLFKNGLAYKAEMPINWCLSCKIGLANEEVVNGVCERCGGEVEIRNKSQWMLKITDYAEKLLAGLEDVDYLPEIKLQQRNWIGKSEGINWKGNIKGTSVEFEAFDSVPQTFMAQTFAAIAPDHPLLKEIVSGEEDAQEVLEFSKRIIKERSAKDYDPEKKVEGIFTGKYIDDPYGTGDLPLWVTSFAIADYGSGIVFCSAHDERDFAFAKKYNIELRPVMFPADKEEAEKVKNLEYCYHHAPDGVLALPKEFEGRKWSEAREDIIKYVEDKGVGKRAVNYKLRDWIFSRQRYWGEPIPLIYCEKCGYVPVKDEDLPVILPEVEKYQPRDDGQSPLASVEEWINVSCPDCGGKGKRETDVMPNWAGSSWYFLRYTDPKNDKEFASKKALEFFMPVDWYNGGMEHVNLHLLYSRFWNLFLYDIGQVPYKEPYKKRTKHGVVLGPDGKKMSKSLGNVINPDPLMKEFGADALRLYVMFMGPFDQMIPWDKRGILGPARFLEKVWKVSQEKVKEKDSGKVVTEINKLIKKVDEDIEKTNFNTSVSSMMSFINLCLQEEEISKETWQKFLLVLAPFAPYITEELWQGEESIHVSLWPKYNESLIKEKTFELVIQINGKVRDKVEAEQGISQAEVGEIVLARDVVKKWIGEKPPKKVIFVPNRLINLIV